MNQPQRVESLSHAQRKRLAYIDFRLYFFGEVGRPDLIDRFSVAPAGATRDLALYDVENAKLAPGYQAPSSPSKKTIGKKKINGQDT